MQNLNSDFHYDSLAKLETLYGSCLEQMPQPDLLAILHALTECSYIVSDGSESEHLGIVASEIHGHDFEDLAVPQILNELDEELEGLPQALSLIEALAAYAQIGLS
ncbi:MAG: hypothetical protein F6J95_007670 [Leptolyngbya sp. SIO1E4]|nr:hypothetical protein [Leptolyngbya sp. SIO1E4]